MAYFKNIACFSQMFCTDASHWLFDRTNTCATAR